MIRNVCSPGIEKRVFNIFKKQLRKRNISKEITYQTIPKEDLGLEQFDFLELIIELEHEFDIPVPDKYAVKIPPIGEVISFIKNNYNQGEKYEPGQIIDQKV